MISPLYCLILVSSATYKHTTPQSCEIYKLVFIFTDEAGAYRRSSEFSVQLETFGQDETWLSSESARTRLGKP